MKKLVVMVLAAAVFGVPAAAAAASCEQVTGDFVADVVPCPGPFCTAGTLTGDLNATYAFAMTAARSFRSSSTSALDGRTRVR